MSQQARRALEHSQIAKPHTVVPKLDVNTAPPLLRNQDLVIEQLQSSNHEPIRQGPVRSSGTIYEDNTVASGAYNIEFLALRILVEGCSRGESVQDREGYLFGIDRGAEPMVL